MVRLIFENVSDHLIAKRIHGECLAEVLISHHFEIASLLFDHGLGPSLQFNSNHTVSRISVEWMNHDLAKFLLSKEALPSNLEPALKDGKTFSSKGDYSDDQSRIVKELSLVMAAKNKDLEMIKLLLQYGAKRNLEPQSAGFVEQHQTGPDFDPVLATIRIKSLKMMELLVTKKSDLCPLIIKCAIRSMWEEGIHLLSFDPTYTDATESNSVWPQEIISARDGRSLEVEIPCNTKVPRLKGGNTRYNQSFIDTGLGVFAFN
ncbi:hypothetical protein N7478_006152 [Penicillium angulare]|uniref:uncharacterized protein n=1 Tax=Penicillium angulare TaxID=116970 RepID=UPI00254189A2|nr:uncharacterized protein N7478_006152 [Penicillium angulare]KAJ5280780.1 hypothetical protein N7478_006152 [Penicillium angulare]